MSDLIDRQAAIEALDEQIAQCNKALKSLELSMKDEYAAKVEKASLTAFRERLEYLPPAQPEIILCKDCKHHWTHKCMDSMPIERCDLEQTFYDAEHDFCSLAEKREVTE